MSAWSDLPQSVRDRFRTVVFERDGYRCQIQGPKCIVDRKLELDHIVPLEFGGALLDLDNMRTGCEPCNRGRRVRHRPASTVEVAPSREW